MLLGFVVAVIAIGFCLWQRRPPHLRCRIIVNLEDRDETTLKGVLWAQRGPWLVLRDVQVLQGERPAVAADGEVVVHRDRISFTQIVPV